MATFFERLTAANRAVPRETKLSPHVVSAAMYEYREGNFTRQQVVNALELNASEEADMVLLYQRLTQGGGNALGIDEFQYVIYIGESGLAYTTDAAITSRFGIVRP